MSAHSPEPWRLVPFPALDHDVVVGADGSDVAHVVTEHSDERRATDGRFIEAAPELLAALKLEHYDHICEYGPWT